MKVYRLQVQGSNGVATSGTAWSPGENLIVTAWHSVGSDDRWHIDSDPLAHYKLLAGGSDPILLHPIAFDATRDLAILGITGRRAARVTALDCVIPTPATIVGKTFEIHGYADALPGVGLVTIDGKIMRFLRDDEYPIQLAIDHCDIGDYAGVSGAPLFVDDRVVGIVRSQTGVRSLWAVPTDWLQHHIRHARDRKLIRRAAWCIAVAGAILACWFSCHPSRPAVNPSQPAEHWPLVHSTMVFCGTREPLLVYDGNGRAVPVGPSYIDENGQMVVVAPPERIEFSSSRYEIQWSCGTAEKHTLSSPTQFDAVKVGRDAAHASFWMYRRDAH